MDEICLNALPVLNEFRLSVLTLLICAATLASYNKLLPGRQMNVAVKINACFEDRLLLNRQDLSGFRARRRDEMGV